MLVESGHVAVDTCADAAEQPTWVTGDPFSDFERPNDRRAYPPPLRRTRIRLAFVKDAGYSRGSVMCADGAGGDTLHYWWRGVNSPVHYSPRPAKPRGVV